MREYIRSSAIFRGLYGRRIRRVQSIQEVLRRSDHRVLGLVERPREARIRWSCVGPAWYHSHESICKLQQGVMKGTSFDSTKKQCPINMFGLTCQVSQIRQSYKSSITSAPLDITNDFLGLQYFLNSLWVMSAHLGQLCHLVELKTLSRPEIVVNQDQGSRIVLIVTASDSDSNTSSSSRIAAVSPRSQSSSATSDDEAYDQLDHSQDSDDDRSSDKILTPHSRILL